MRKGVAMWPTDNLSNETLLNAVRVLKSHSRYYPHDIDHGRRRLRAYKTELRRRGVDIKRELARLNQGR